MRVIVLFEESGTLRDRIINAGHDAISVDLMPGRGIHRRHHWTMDVEDALERAAGAYDLVIAHPPCTAVAVSGNRYYADTRKRAASIAFVERLWGRIPADVPVAFENPVGVLSTQSTLGPATQYVQPYEFGEDASKRTGLWLRGLPPLVPTQRVPGRIVDGRERWANQTDSGQNRLPPSVTRAQQRSQTYGGIADAMVDQWIVNPR